MPIKPSAKIVPAPASGTHDSASSSRTGRARNTARLANSTTVISGMGSSAMNSGIANQRSKMRGDNKGVPIDTAAIPAAVPHRPNWAQRVARRCNSPSVL